MADLPRVIENMDALPEPLREPMRDYYAPGSGDYAGKLVLRGTDPSVERLEGALSHEREQRSAAVKERDTFKTELEKLKTKPAKDDPKPTKPSADGETVESLKQKLENVMQTSEERIAALEKQVNEERQIRTTKETELSEREHNEELRAAAKAAGASDVALDDVVARMQRMIKIKDGKRVPVNPDGSTRLGKERNPTQPMDWEELAAGVLKKAPHLARQNRGGGGGGGDQGDDQPSAGDFVAITKAEAKDPEVWRAKRAEADKRGVPLKRVD